MEYQVDTKIKKRLKKKKFEFKFLLTTPSVLSINVFSFGGNRCYGPLTQSVEYLPFKQRVVGSSPTRPTLTSVPIV
jgi:hypothetical protein